MTCWGLVILVDAIKAPDTSDTSDKNLTYQPKPAWIKACTPDTSDTSKNTNSREVFLNWRWASLARTETLAMIWAAWPAASQAGAGRQTCRAVGQRGTLLFFTVLITVLFDNENQKPNNYAGFKRFLDSLRADQIGISQRFTTPQNPHASQA